MRELQVLIAGEFAGRLVQSPAGNITFQYQENYTALQTPLSLSIPPRAESYSKSQVLPYLQGLLPDNDAALRAIASRYSVSSQNPFAILEHIGTDVAGAVQFVPFGFQPNTEIPSKLTEADVANLLREKIAEYSSGQPGLTAGLFSLAGAQPKLALRKDLDGNWTTGSHLLPTTHILKPLPNQLPNVDIAELLTMECARQLGLSVAGVEFAQFDSLRVLVVERYDRRREGNSVARIHQEDFLQALGISPFKKYQKTEGGPGLRKIGNLFRLIPAESRTEIVRSFFQAFVFNLLVHATDAHAKNYSFLLEGNSVSLAPLYDLISGAGLAAATESAMAVDGRYRFDEITEAAIVHEGELLSFPSPDRVLSDLKDRLEQAVANAKEVVSDQLPRGLQPVLTAMADQMRRFG